MDENQICGAIVRAISKVQQAGGHPAPATSGEIVPIGDLSGFDSLTGLEATVLIEQELGCRLSPGSAFVSLDGKNALAITDIIRRVQEMIAQGGTS